MYLRKRFYSTSAILPRHGQVQCYWNVVRYASANVSIKPAPHFLITANCSVIGGC